LHTIGGGILAGGADRIGVDVYPQSVSCSKLKGGNR